ncbi:hypothetical protein GA715_09495 [Leuconostoc mesenteroides]|uniref:hypothetical protein n=1 Tax=Leuconostoc mesenteroides TaxID=1245 RepID=UPI002954B34B|nr:hypothetical protein [Leuconostoc mesenteroides]MDV7740369.1 hypothetical protein [Leuconostoc mesenteroides]
MQNDKRISGKNWLMWRLEDINVRIKFLSQKMSDVFEIPDYLEMFDCLFLIKNKKIKVKNSDQIEIRLSQNLVDEFYKRVSNSDDISTYFNFVFINSDKITEKYFYQDTLLNIFITYDFSRILLEKDFQKIILEYEVPIGKLLKDQYWSKKYPNTMKSMFLGKTKNLEFLLNNFTDSKNKNYIPKNITKEEFYNLADKYINDIASQNENYFESNLNYLRLLNTNLSGINKFLDIDAELKLQINEQIDLKNANLFKNALVHSDNISIIFHPDSNEKFDSQFKNGFFGIVDVDFIKSHGDVPTLLTYLKYLSHFFTANGILNLSSFPNVEGTVFDKFMGIKPKNNYETNYLFDVKTTLILRELGYFDQVIRVEHDLSYEKIFDYFFNDYSENVFNMKWVHVPFSEEKSLSIRIKILLSSEENIRKQWKVYTKKNSIDSKLLNYEKTPNFSELPSLLPKKYIYAETDVTKNILYLLFSDQSMMGYISDSVNEQDFVNLIIHQKVNYEDFPSYNLTNLNLLIDKNVICRAENGLIYFDAKQKKAIFLYGLLWSHGVINYYNLPSVLSNSLKNEYQLIIDEFLSNGRFESKSSLFSQPEIDFLNYLLNNKDFDNSKGLRNKHEHGHSSNFDGEYYEDYLYSVSVFLLYIMKINEEFHLQSLLKGGEGYFSET